MCKILQHNHRERKRGVGEGRGWGGEAGGKDGSAGRDGGRAEAREWPAAAPEREAGAQRDGRTEAARETWAGPAAGRTRRDAETRDAMSPGMTYRRGRMQP